MTRHRLLVGLLVLLLIVLAGCGGSSEPEATAVPPTNTPVPPTNTPVPPTNTPVPPTATPVPPTATPVPPTATPEPEPEPEAGAFEAVQAAAEAYVTSDAKPVMTADALFENLNDGDPDNDPFVVSVRSPDHYALGHIPGAINIPWKNIAKPESLAKLPTDRPIVTYCYTGHTGQAAATALNLLGYDTINLKFGMMGWTQDDEVLATKRYDPATSPDYPLETEPNEATETYDFPELAIETDMPDDVVRAAVDAYLNAEGMKPVITADAVFENLNDGDPDNDPVIVSVRGPDHYALGHIPGAINIPWKTIADPANLAKLPSDKPIVTYCYTGHTGQLANTVLGVLGYDTVNMKYGMMGWTQDDEVLATGRYDPATSPDYPLETDGDKATETGMADNAVQVAAVDYFSQGTKNITAEALFENLNDGDEGNDPYIISVRSPDDYAKGHIAGAVNMSPKDVLNPETLAALPADQEIVVYCYTGQTASHVTSQLNTAGLDAKNLLFGMSSWSDDPEVYNKRFNPDATPMGYATVTEPFEAEGTFDLASPLAAEPAPAGDAYFDGGGPRYTSAEALFENLNDGDTDNDPYIISVRSQEDYDKGHIDGAVWYSPKELFQPDVLDSLPTDREIVVACYTGQTASQVTSALNALGYDASSLLHGMSGWTDDPEVFVKRFNPGVHVQGYPTESGS
ncbi:MAG: rhodanese-like domain-containing protein [Chloroflexota bacterium]|nr:rhodanese-like domain-containing protein [Chloroflexota bacterium]